MAARPSGVRRSPLAASWPSASIRSVWRPLVEPRAQPRQALVLHQHEEAGFRQIARRRRIEARGPVLDGVEAVGRQGLALGETRAGERLGRQALHRIAENRFDCSPVRHLAVVNPTARRMTRAVRKSCEFLFHDLNPAPTYSAEDRPSGVRQLQTPLPPLMYVMVRSLPIDDDLPAPDGRKARPREKGYGFREIHRSRARIRAVCAKLGPARGPSAIFARSSTQGPAGRPRRARRRFDRPFRRQFSPGPAGGRGGARQAAQGLGRRRRPGLSRPGAGADFRYRPEDRREGRRQLRHRRTAAVGDRAR